MIGFSGEIGVAEHSPNRAAANVPVPQLEAPQPAAE